jgi:recombination protein RecT
MAESKEVVALTKINNSLIAKTDSMVNLGCELATVNKMRTTFMLQCRKNPKLMECSLGSIAQAFTDAGTIGLEPNGVYAHLIPYGKECKYMPDYKGFIKLARESGEISDMTANVVRENDVFEHEYGSNKYLKHVKSYGTDKERGKRIAAYSYVKFKDGSEDFRVLTEGEVMHAKKSSKSGNIWDNDPDPMWAKTAVRQHAKFLPSQKKLQLAAEMEEVMDLKDVDVSDITETKTKDNTSALKDKIAAKKKSKETKPAKAETKKDKPETKKPVEEPPPVLDENGQTVDPDATVNPGDEEAPEPNTVDSDIPGGKFMAAFTEFIEVNEVSQATITTELQSLGYPEGIDQVIADDDGNQEIVLDYFKENFTKTKED